MNPAGTVTGRFSCSGYEVLLDGQPVYAAGNNPHDSAAPAEPGYELPLSEIAAETGAVFGGIEEDDNV